MANSLKYIVDENLTELVEVTSFNLEFCNKLKETDLVSNSQYQDLISLLVNIDNRDILLCYK